jgi:zinc transporter, ZIP family
MAFGQNTILIILVLSFLSGATTLIGMWLAFFLKGNKRMIAGGVGFSTCMMLFISFFELIPESIRQAGSFKSLAAVGMGMLVLASMNYIIPHTHLISEKCDRDFTLLKAAYLTVIGFILHDFPEGFAMADSYAVSANLGIFMAIAIALHNIPEEFAMCLPLVLTNKKRSFFYKVGLISGLAEPAGAILGVFAIHAYPFLTPIFLAFAAGAMIFIAVHELWPIASRFGRPISFMAGGLLSLLIYFLLTFFI